jgi:hypothetical protein
MRYKLDDLGAFQFEQLAQSLLKAQVGLSVESWGRRSDLGRDAYTPNSLRFPDKNYETAGPFVFQVKFVEGANAAGAKPRDALLGSVSKEISRITKRQIAPNWTEPSYLTFITNAPLEAVLREEVRRKLKSTLPNSEIVIYGGDDLCDLLDQPPSVYRSFPQLLSIRDLDALIRTALTRESEVRSAVAIEAARELVPVFAPTSNYEKAWDVLRKHHFAVLEGPPEVGKSAIAWMTGLSLAGEGWEVECCRRPDDFFKVYDTSKRQLFIADDAFGLTEYDPTRPSIWETDLDLIFRRLDVTHWFIWTSRKHILERAVNRMDARGTARYFPEPGAVLVDASLLSAEERALMLFRHARAAGLEEAAKRLVRGHASQIVKSRDFTPERVRRFVSEYLPPLAAKARSTTLTPWQISAQIDEAIRNPTKQMQLTFRGLPTALKWYLVSMLELPQGGNSDGSEDLEKKYLSYCPDEMRISFEEATQQLRDAFIRVRQMGRSAQFVDWIHPSYRDLVIDELAADSDLRTQFLKRASIEGLKLAVSDTGGRAGLRRLPFVQSIESWDLLRERALVIVRELDQDRDLLEILTSAAKGSNSTSLGRSWEGLISSVCSGVKAKWDASARRLKAGDLAAFRGARSVINSNQDIPEILGTWLSLEKEFHEIFSPGHSLVPRDLKRFDELTRFAEEAEACVPGFLGLRGFPEQFELAVESLFERAKRGFSELKYSVEYDVEDDRGEFASEVSQLAGAFDRMLRIPKADSAGGAVKWRATRLGEWADELREMSYAFRSDEHEFDSVHEPQLEPDEEPPADDFDIDALFAEL